MSEKPKSPLSHLGPFRLLSRLGQGGMGQTFLVEQRRPLPGGGEYVRKLAIKRVRAELQNDTHAVQRFVDEIRQQALIHCDHVVSSFNVDFDAEGRPYHVMEWIDGCDLSALLRRYYEHTAFYEDCDPDQLEHLEADDEECVSLPVAAHIMLGIAEAISTMHAEGRGVVHRDLKPGNVLISLHGRVCVTDFGLTYSRDRNFETTFTAHPSAMGSKPYMAPEQWLCQNPPEHSWDLYSLGVISYELLTGQLPFPVADGGQRVTSEDPAVRDLAMRRFRAIRPDIPAELTELLAALIARSHTDRPDHVSDVLTALTHIPITRADLLQMRHHVGAIALEKPPVTGATPLPATVPVAPHDLAAQPDPVLAASSPSQPHPRSGTRRRRATLSLLLPLGAALAASVFALSLDSAPKESTAAPAKSEPVGSEERPPATAPQVPPLETPPEPTKPRKPTPEDHPPESKPTAKSPAVEATAPAKTRKSGPPPLPRAVTIRSIDCVGSPVKWAHVYHRGKHLGFTPTKAPVRLPIGIVTLGLSKDDSGATTRTRVRVRAADATKPELLVDCDKL